MADWIKSFLSNFGDAACVDDATLVECDVQNVVPACVASPESEAQAAAMIRFAAAHRIPVVPRGNGSSQDNLLPPPKSFLVISTLRMNAIVNHEPGDLVATVQSGADASDVEDEFRRRGQWLPIDASAATIGGIVAANKYGPRALRYGTARDMVLGMTVINGDGVIRKCGGKVVKNVTGYALDKLYIGSFGTLGLVTEVTFKLQPLCPDSYCQYTTVPNMNAALEALRKISTKNLPLEMLQLRVYGKNPGVNIFVSAAGTKAELERIDSEIKEAGRLDFSDDFTQFTLGVNDGEQDTGFRERAFFTFASTLTVEGSNSQPIPSALLRFGCVPSQLSAIFAILKNFETAPQSFGINGGIISLAPLTDSEAARIASEFEIIGVNFAFENIVGVNIPNRWGSPRPEWAMMKQLKAALDPQGIMNPGRFVV